MTFGFCRVVRFVPLALSPQSLLAPGGRKIAGDRALPGIARRGSHVQLAFVLAPLLLASAAATAGEPAPSVLFTTKCSSCHTFGHGDKVGPDLKGVTERRERAWLTKWIQSSTRVIESGDATAVSLFQEYRQQRMPDHEFSEAQITALLDYFAAGGPETEALNQVRPVRVAGAADVKHGERLFYGQARLASGGVACASCHAISKSLALGGSCAPDLGKVYATYRDRGFSQALERSCFPRTSSIGAARVVTEDESLALRAFLNEATHTEMTAAGAHDAVGGLKSRRGP